MSGLSILNFTGGATQEPPHHNLTGTVLFGGSLFHLSMCKIRSKNVYFLFMGPLGNEFEFATKPHCRCI